MSNRNNLRSIGLVSGCRSWVRVTSAAQDLRQQICGQLNCRSLRAGCSSMLELRRGIGSIQKST